MPFKSVKTPPEQHKPVLIKAKGKIKPCVYRYDADEFYGNTFDPYHADSCLRGIHIDDVDEWIYLDDIG